MKDIKSLHRMRISCAHVLTLSLSYSICCPIGVTIPSTVSTLIPSCGRLRSKEAVAVIREYGNWEKMRGIRGMRRKEDTGIPGKEDKRIREYRAGILEYEERKVRRYGNMVRGY